MQITDCTLRDGGYYTQWDFSPRVVDAYFSAMNSLPVDYVEVGYRNLPQRSYYGEFYYLPVPKLEALRNKWPNLKLAVMLNGKSCMPECLPGLMSACRGLIDLVRIATAPDRIPHSLKLAAELRKLGFSVALNVMYLSKMTDDSPIFLLLPDIESLVDTLFLVDSYGGVFPPFLSRIFTSIRERCALPLGFHGHNNLELAFINSLTALEVGAEFIDCTVLGMGRGSGNLRTELALPYFARHSGKSVDLNVLAAVVSEFSVLWEKYQWGSNFPYVVAGLHGMPQQHVMDLLAKKRYSIQQIVSAQLEKSGLRRDEGRTSVREAALVDKGFKTVIVIGGGESIGLCREALWRYAHHVEAPVLVFSSTKNLSIAKDMGIPFFVCLAGNEGEKAIHYSSTEFFNNFLGYILPPQPRTMGTILPRAITERAYELEQSHFPEALKDAPLSIALDLAWLWPGAKIMLAGFDGYDTHAGSPTEMALHHETQEVLNRAERELFSLTATTYTSLVEQSIFAEIMNG